MALHKHAAKDLIEEILVIRDKELPTMNQLNAYRAGNQDHPVAVIQGMPPELARFVDLSRINMVDLVVEVLTQSLYVDGYRPNVAEAGSTEESPGWLVWQANKMDSRQTAVHRGIFTYGTSYVSVLPGEPVPVLKGHSPRGMTVVYSDNQDWPFAALQVEANGEDEFTYTLYTSEAVFTFTSEGGLEFVTVEDHDLEVVPVVRFVNIEDLDDELTSEVSRMVPIQDQIDVTTFSLMVAQHYQAFIQRYVIGWEATSEVERQKATASRLWTFDDPDVQVGQFTQADLSGYLASREDTVQLGAVVSQTPPHHLLGQLINLSAEALAAAEAGHRRKINQRQTTFGESWEQVLALAEVEMGLTPDVSSQVRWRDTEARSLAQTVDALGKMAEMLGIPPEALWERIPGATQQDIQLWKQLAAQADSLGALTDLLAGQDVQTV